MPKFKHNPITNELNIIGAEESDLASLLDLIDDDSPSSNTGASGFITLSSSAATEFNGRFVLFMLNMSVSLSTGTDTEVEFAIQIDSGSDVIIASLLINTSGIHKAIGGTLIGIPSEGSHTINLRWRRLTGTGTIVVDASDRIQLKGIQF